MNKKWTIGKVIGLILGIISLICIIISMVQEGNNIFLNIGLVCICFNLILFIFINEKER